MTDPVKPWTKDDLDRAYKLAFDPTMPTHYGNIYYLSGTLNDVRVAIGTLRPRAHDTSDQEVSSFEAAFTLPRSVAKELASQILGMLKDDK